MSIQYLSANKKIILEGIQLLINIPKTPDKIVIPYGICYNLSNILTDLGLKYNKNLLVDYSMLGYDIVTDYGFVLDWPEYSGNLNRPIKNYRGFLWQGEQLAYRISLLKHLYNKIEKL